MIFLPSAESIARQIRQLFATHSSAMPIYVAVAFWGRGAESLIRAGAKRFHIICNLKSGGTNPDIIRGLMQLENVVVQQLDTLHAKVVIADDGAVVSSANFSTNGLMLEGPASATWQEGGVAIPRSAAVVAEIIDWFGKLWSVARDITETDLAEAEKAWSKRLRQAAAENADPEPIHPVHASAKFQTVHFLDRIRPSQRDLRSAAAIVALGGHTGASMPLSPFVFLFSGGRTTRAFDNHRNKFDVTGSTVRLKQPCIGYFVGTDGSMKTCTDAKRRNSFEPRLLSQVASWMRLEGPRPIELEGSVETATFSLPRANEP